MYFPLREQLKDLFENQGVTLPVNEERDPANISDICDGNLYRSVPLLKESGNISILWSTDGVPLFKSANYSMWPIHCLINELPLEERKKHILLTGLWFGSDKPTMHGNFLKPFVDECLDLEANGFSWTRNGEMKQTKVVNLLCSCDSPARALLQGFKQYNGRHGCSFCTHEGQVVKQGNGFSRIYPLELPVPPLRTVQQTIRDAAIATQTGQAENGVKTASDLLLLPSFHIVNSFPVEYLHSVCLGVVKRCTSMWFENTGEAYYVGNKMMEVDLKIKCIKPPDEITRIPRSIKERKFWKGNEWRAFLFYAPIIMANILPAAFLEHWLLLASALHVLMQPNISKAMLNAADTMLAKFVLHMPILYGVNECTFNVHMLTHFKHSIEQCGPIPFTSAFIFEGHCGHLKELFHGTRSAPVQIARTFLLIRHISRMSRHILTNNTSENVQGLFNDLARGYPLTKKYVKVNDVGLYGSGIYNAFVASHQLAIDALQGNRAVEGGLYQKRMCYRGTFYNTHSYCHKFARFNCFTLYGNYIFKITHIVQFKANCACLLGHCSCTSEVVLIGEKIVVQRYTVRDADCGVLGNYIRKGPLYGAIIACYASQLGDKCMLINIPSNNEAMYLPIPKGIAYSD